LQEVIRAMGVISERTRFTASKDEFALDAEGDTDKLRKALQVLDGSKLPAEPVSSLFSLDYLKDITRAMKDAGTLTVHAGNNHPIRVDFEMDGIEASYLLAPRIEQEDAA
jgi:proliferating cell nuclear antigen